MIAVIDYGMGNLRSVTKAAELFHDDIILTNQPQKLKDAKALILPGVGAFSAAMKNIEPLQETILGEIAKGKLILGICLGLQLFYTKSSEHGETRGFGLINQEITSFKETPHFPKGLSLPQIGWNSVTKNSSSRLLKGLPDVFDVYFVHSYYAPISDYTTGVTNYGFNYCSVIEKDNIMATQFHPEKSSELGLAILKNFLDLAKKA